MKHSFTVDAKAAGKRLDLVVGEALALSRAQQKALFEKGEVRVDGRRAKKGQLTQAGQRIELEASSAPPEAAADFTAELTVLYQDADLVFIDKAAGIPSHPLEPGEIGTVANALVARFPECATASADPREGGLCHRLDTGTSGVLLAARTRTAWEKLRQAFSSDGVDKRYWAAVTGPLADEGIIDLPLKPARANRVEPDAAESVASRPARSTFTLLARSGEYCHVEVRIHTGVRHQIRAHLAAIGAPVLGDALYGGRVEPGTERFFLHARSLELAHPTTGARLKISSPLPAEFAETLKRHGLDSPS